MQVIIPAQGDPIKIRNLNFKQQLDHEIKLPQHELQALEDYLSYVPYEEPLTISIESQQAIDTVLEIVGN